MNWELVPQEIIQTGMNKSAIKTESTRSLSRKWTKTYSSKMIYIVLQTQNVKMSQHQTPKTSVEPCMKHLKVLVK